MLDAIETEVYKFIRRYILRHTYAPSEMEICDEIEACSSRRKVRRVIKKLIDANYLRQIPNKRRNLELIENRIPLQELPILCIIPAGPPFEPLESDQVLNLSELLVGNNRYVLQVMGNSMNGDNICHGDFILCEKRDTAEDGEIIVAQINGKETTLKRLHYNNDNTVALVSSNPDIAAMLFPREHVEILGVYLGLIRLIEPADIS